MCEALEGGRAIRRGSGARSTSGVNIWAVLKSAVPRVLCKFSKQFILALQIYKYMCANGQCDEFAYIIYRCYITTLTYIGLRRDVSCLVLLSIDVCSS